MCLLYILITKWDFGGDGLHDMCHTHTNTIIIIIIYTRTSKINTSSAALSIIVERSSSLRGSQCIDMQCKKSNLRVIEQCDGVFQ